MEKDEYYEEKQIGLKTYYRLHPAFDWRELSNEELTKKINKLQAELKQCEGKPVSDEPLNATCNMHDVVGQSEQFTCKHCGTHEKQWSRKNDDWYCKTCGHICR